MPKPLKPSPHPWRVDPYKDGWLKIVAADGATVGYLPQPKTIEDHTNQRLVLRCPVLLERIKTMVTLYRASKMLSPEEGKNSPTVTSAQALIDEIEKIAAPEKPKPPEVL